MALDSIGKQRVYGMFAVAFFAFGVFLSLQVKDDGDLFTETFKRSYRCYVPDAGHIQVGSDVKQCGLNMGKVRELNLVEHNGEYVAEVVFEVKDLCEVRANSRARFEVASLLTGSHLAVTPGTTDAEELPPGSAIETQSMQGITATVAKLNAMLDELPSGGLGRMLLDEHKYGNVNAILDTLAHDGGMGKWLLGSRIHASIEPMTDDLRTAASNLRRGTEGEALPLAKLLHDANLGNEFGVLIGDLQVGMQGVRTLGNDLAGGAGVLARLASDETLGEKVVDAVDGFKLASGNLRAGKSPLAVLLADAAVGEQLATGVASLSTAADRLANGDNILRRLVEDPHIYEQAIVILRELRESVEDVREAYPIDLMAGLLIDNAPSLLINSTR
jgi:hypothetical protein